MTLKTTGGQVTTMQPWIPVQGGYLCDWSPGHVGERDGVVYWVSGDGSEYVLDLTQEALAEARRRNVAALSRRSYSTDATPEALPQDAPWPRDECGDRGPRIGEDGTICRRSKGHEGPHRTAPSDGFGDVHWSDREQRNRSGEPS